MKRKLIVFLCALCALTFTPIYAVTVTQNCEKHADEVIIMTAEIAELNDRQYGFIRNAIIESCLNNIIKSENNTIKSVDNKDWLTEKILSSETDRKEGNKRLKKLK
mgnify:FL=1